MKNYFENIIGILFLISWFITITFGCIGIYNILGDSIFANIIGMAFWVINGYMHMRAYSAVIDDYNEKNNKKQS